MHNKLRKVDKNSIQLKYLQLVRDTKKVIKMYTIIILYIFIEKSNEFCLTIVADPIV